VKKAAAIAIIAILLFNLGGYRMLADFLQTKAELNLETRIDEGNYDTQQVIELSVVSNLPYRNDWKEWERCNGTIEVNGLHYQYIERKLEKGSMHYRCLPNAEKINVLTARDEFFQLVNSFNQQPDSKKSSPSIVINNFIGDYDDVQFVYTAISPAITANTQQWPRLVTALPEAPTPAHIQPPRHFIG
jgi:hypothetical protein